MKVSNEAVDAAERAYETFGAGMRDALEAALPYLTPEQPTAHITVEPRRRKYVTGYLMDGRTIDLIGEHASHCANLEPHEVHWPELKVGEGNPRVAAAGTYVCPGVPPLVQP